VGKLLRKRGVDLDNNRFLILQGEVEQISMMKPKAQNPHEEGLLEYLEDIIGSNRYVEQTVEAEQKVEVQNEKRIERLNQVKVVEKEKDNLEGAKKEAEELLSKERAICKKKNELFQVFEKEAHENVESVEQKRSRMQEKLDYEQEKLKESEKQLKTMETTYTEKTGEYEEINSEMAKCKKEFTAFERKDIKYREDLKHKKAQLKKFNEAVKNETTKSQKALKKSEEASAALPSLETKVEETTLKLGVEEEKLQKIEESLKVETEELRVSLEAKQTELAPFEQEVDSARAILEATQTEKELIEDRSNTAKRQLANLKNSLDELKESVPASKKELKTLKSAKKEKESTMKSIEKDVNEANDELAKVTSTVNELYAKVEGGKASMQQSAGQSRVVKALMAASKKGGDLAKAGLLGRLGDLGAIDDEYDVAITTACGQLNWIVTETAAGAQACLNYLKKHDIGRTTFLIMEKIAEGVARRKVKAAPNGVHKLVDLVRVADERHRVAFAYALGDTLVVEDLAQAKKVAYSGGGKGAAYRVVTKDGKLISQTGTMAGGGGKPRKGGMKSALEADAGGVSADEIRKLESKLQKALGEQQQLRKTAQELKRSEGNLPKEVRQIELKISKIEFNLENVDTRQQELVNQLGELEAAAEVSAEDEQKIKAIAKTIKANEKALGQAEGSAKGLRGELQVLKKKMADVGGPKLRKQKETVSNVQDHLDEISSKVSKAKVDTKTGEKNFEKAKKAAEKATAEVEAMEKSIEKTRGEFKQIEDGALEVTLAYEKTQKLLKAKEEELEVISGEFETLKKNVQKVATVEVEIQGQLEEYRRVISQNEHKSKHWGAKLKEVRDSYASYVVDGDEEEEEEEEEDKMEEGEKLDATPEEGAEAMEGEEATEGETPDEKADKPVETKVKRGPLPDFEDEELKQFCKEDLEYEITMLEQERDTLKGEVNMGAIEHFRKKEREYAERIADLDAATKERDEARRHHEQLRRQRLEEFMAGFGVITMKLKEMYQMITLGGDAELELVDSLDPFSEGIVFSVRPPKKSWKDISNLSGGEKTLSSLALVFALHHYKPTPLYVMDEIDAALDFKNVSIVANYIKERTKNAQFIIISLRNNMFELADRLVGIYKTNNATKSVTINPKRIAMDASLQAKAQAAAQAMAGGAALSDMTNQ
jgi:structural maintenance of chromosome 4